MTVSIKRNNRSLSYRFTVDTKKDATLHHLRELVKANNKLARKYNHLPKQRVVLMARGERVKWALKYGHSRRSYDQYLPHQFATSFDVYVYDN